MESKISNDVLAFLEYLLKKDFQKISMKSLKVELHKNFKAGFKPEEVDRGLVQDTRLTAYGIWLINPKNKYLEATERAVNYIRSEIQKNAEIERIASGDISKSTSISENEAQIALLLLYDLGFFSSASHNIDPQRYGYTSASFPDGDNAIDRILEYKNLKSEIESVFRKESERKREYNKFIQSNSEDPVEILQILVRDPWHLIKDEYGFSKPLLSKRINYIEDPFKRSIIIRDISQAFILTKLKIAKPAVILAGGVIEELLRLLLLSKGHTLKHGNFNLYIQECKKLGLLKTETINLSDAVRQFRNYVHLAKEEKAKDSIKHAVAVSAIASVFIVVEAIK